MKSFIDTLADYREAPFERDVVLRCPQEHIQSQMKHLTRGYKTTKPVEKLEKGDVAVLSLESQLEKFNRPAVFVTVGGGLFDKAFEATLIGRLVGETFETIVAEKSVRVTIKQANRTVFPEPTDEMAAAYALDHDEFAGILTVAEYRNRIIDTYLADKRREVKFGAMDAIIGYVLTHSLWNFDEEEIQKLISQGKADIDERLSQEGKVFDDLTDEEVRLIFGLSSKEEVPQALLGFSEQRIATMLWMAAMTGKDASEYSLEDLENESNWDFLEKFVDENLNIQEER